MGGRNSRHLSTNLAHYGKESQVFWRVHRFVKTPMGYSVLCYDDVHVLRNISLKYHPWHRRNGRFMRNVKQPQKKIERQKPIRIKSCQINPLQTCAGLLYWYVLSKYSDRLCISLKDRCLSAENLPKFSNGHSSISNINM